MKFERLVQELAYKNIETIHCIISLMTNWTPSYTLPFFYTTIVSEGPGYLLPPTSTCKCPPKFEHIEINNSCWYGDITPHDSQATLLTLATTLNLGCAQVTHFIHHQQMHAITLSTKIWTDRNNSCLNGDVNLTPHDYQPTSLALATTLGCPSYTLHTPPAHVHDNFAHQNLKPTISRLY